MPSIFKKPLTVDQAAEALYTIMGKEDKSGWLERLKTVPRLDIVRATDELLFLDFFAIYFSLKYTRAPGWADKGEPVFEKLFLMIGEFVGGFWEEQNAGTKDDAFKMLLARITAYGARVEEPDSAEPDTMLRSIGETFAMYALTDETFCGPDGRAREDRFPDVLKKLSQDHANITITVGSAAFNYRVQSLYGMFDSFRLT